MFDIGRYAHYLKNKTIVWLVPEGMREYYKQWFRHTVEAMKFPVEFELDDWDTIIEGLSMTIKNQLHGTDDLIEILDEYRDKLLVYML